MSDRHSDPSSVSDPLRGRPTRVAGSKPIGEQQPHHLDHCVGCNRSNGRDQWLLSAPNPCHTWSYAIEFPIRNKALLLNFRSEASLMAVTRDQLRELSVAYGMSETGVIHAALAQWHKEYRAQQQGIVARQEKSPGTCGQQEVQTSA